MAKRRDGVECDTTCQLCERPILAKRGLIAHHGYTRPEFRSGYQSPSCYGARRLPYEQDRTVIAEVLERHLLPQLKEAEATLARIEAGGPTLKVPNPKHERWLHMTIQRQRYGAMGGYNRDPGPEPERWLDYVEEPFLEGADSMRFSEMPEWYTAQCTAFYEYEASYKSWKYQAERRVEDLRQERDRLQARWDNWVCPGILAE